MKTRFIGLGVFLLLMLVFGLVQAQVAPPVFEQWTTAEGTQNFYVKASVKSDASGNVYVAGATLNGAGDYDLLVAKYDEEGELLWAEQYDGAGNGHDAATAIAIDDYFNVYVTGLTFTGGDDTLDVITIAYDDTGAQLWAEVYAGTGSESDIGTSIHIHDDRIYVGGIVVGSNGQDFLLLKYESNGTLDWDGIYDHATSNDLSTALTFNNRGPVLVGATQTGVISWDFLAVEFSITDGSVSSSATVSGGSVGFDHVRAVDKDALGNIYLTGTVANGLSGNDIHTVMIDSNLTVLWSVDYSSSGGRFDEGTAVIYDENGNVLVGGYVTTATEGTNFVTLQYDLTGSLQWAVTYNDSADGADTLKAMAVDAEGNVTVTGSSWNGSSLDYHTIQYDDAGDMNWAISFNDKYNYTDVPLDLALTDDGGVVVTGQSMNPDSTTSYVTVKYFEPPQFVMPADSDSISTSLRFLANRDQLLGTDGDPVERVRFYSNNCYPNVYVMDDTLSYVFFQGIDTTDVDTLHRVDMSFNVPSAAKRLLPVGKESYFNNYYLGHIPEGRPFVSLYKQLYMQEVWTDIDVEYSSNQRGLKYYIIVHPGGEPSSISLHYEGHDDLSIDGNGALVIESSVGELVQPQALAYEMDASGELTLLGWQPDYDLSGDDVTFDGLGSWDTGGDLVFEVNWGYRGTNIAANTPEWGTYYGNTSEESCTDVVLDENEELYVLGRTTSPLFPLLNPFQGNIGGGQDAFVGKVFHANYGLSWMTYFGGDGDDEAYDIASSQVNNRVYFCGATQFNSLPLLTFPSSGAFVDDYGYNQGVSCGYIAALERNNGIREWLTYFGGDDAASCNGIKTDRYGDIYVVGGTHEEDATSGCSPNGSFPLCNSLGSFMQVENQRNDDTFNPCTGSDGFIAKFDNNLTLVWSTYFGGNGMDALLDLAIDNAYDKLYVVGVTQSARATLTYCLDVSTTSAIPLMDAGGYYQFQLNGDNNWFPLVHWDGIIAKFTLDGDPEWSSFFGGGGYDQINSIALDPDGDVIIAGTTNTSAYDINNCVNPSGSGFPQCSTTANQYNQSYGGDYDVFIARFDRFTDIQWSTFLGSDGVDDGPPKIVSDNFGNKFVIGTINGGSTTPDWVAPNVSFYEQSSSGGSGDIFVCGFNSTDEIIYGSYFGGNGPESGSAIAMTTDRVYLGGGTGSTTDFPLNDFDPTPGATDIYYNALSGGFKDAFFAQIEIPFLVKIPEANSPISNRLLVYPNPSAGKFTIDWESSGKGGTEVEVFDILGHCMLSQGISSHVGSNQRLIDLSALPSGIYCIVLCDNGLKQSQKIIKQ